MEIKKFKILIVTLVIVSSFGIINVISIESNENLVSIETDSNMWSFNSSWDNWKCNNDSTGNAISDAYVNSTIGYISGQSKMNETGNGQAKGWMRHSIEWDCPVDNESGEVNISYEYNAFAFLRVNSSGYAHAKLWLTFFIDDIQHEVIIYNNTLDEINESVNFSGHSIENWLKNLTLSNKTYMIGVNASYEIEYTGNDTQSMAWLYFDIPDTTIDESDGNTEYWAVLIGVDYAWCTEFWLHIPFDENAEQMKKMLLVSDHWQEDHIKVLTEEEATWVNIIEALRWLDKKDDGDDVSLVYYSAHGGNFNFEEKWGIKIDLWPWDEEDGYDEYLTTYWSGKRLFAPIWDDLLNSLLDLLDSENVVVIIDACFSGGMIDSDKSSWITEFSGEINNDNKVIVTSCGEQEYSFIDSNDGISFSYFIMEGLQGYADDISEGGNGNGAVSIEEAFEYAEPKYKSLFGDPINPEINDPDEIKSIKKLFMVEYSKEDGTLLGKGNFGEPPYISISDWIIKEKQIRNCNGICKHKQLEINIKIGLPKLDRKITFLHEMIHAYEYELKEPFNGKMKEVLLLFLYKKLEKQFGKEKLDKILKKIMHVLFWKDNYHSLLFVLKSLDLDNRLNLPFGSVFGYGKIDFFQ